MHELSIALNIIDSVTEIAHQQQARVQTIHVAIGPLSGVVSRALVSAFELAREGTELADCKLVVDDLPLTIYCAICAAERPAESMQSLRCAVCHAPAIRLIGGQELELTALELQDEPSNPLG